MNITNNLQLPTAFYNSVQREKHNQENCLSATTLLRGMKDILLTDRHWNEITVDLSKFVWAIWGTAVHSIFEKNTDEHEQAELSLEYNLDGVKITGKIDNYNEKDMIISDYKTASVNKVKFNSFDDWQKQGLIYAWLLKRNGKPIKKCRFIALLKDHSPREAMYDKSYPQNPCYIFEFSVSDKNILEIDDFIRQKVEEYKNYKNLPDDEIPRCSDSEVWKKPDEWAITKKGASRCVNGGKFKNKAECDKAFLKYNPKDYYIDVRKGEFTRCNSYCDCKEFCSFWKNLQAKKESI